MDCTQKRTQTSLAELAKINAGLLELGQILASTVPPDFAWSFTFGQGELVASWTWAAVSCHSGDVRASTVAELLRQWRNIDWAAERSLADVGRFAC